MGMTIDDKIDHLKTLRNVWEVELRHSFNTTEKEINQDIVDSLNSAIETMRKYQKIEQIYQKWNVVNDFSYNQAMSQIGEVLEDGNVD